MLFNIAWKSLLNRKTTAWLTVLSIAVSTFVLLGVNHLRIEAKHSFSKTISGTDLIVGSRTGNINLLMYSVFKIGNATNNIPWRTYQQLLSDKRIQWAVPISLGDSHRGYRVMGTTNQYFSHYKYGAQRHLDFEQGKAFSKTFETVIGYDVAQKLNYHVGDPIVLSHGTGSNSFTKHDKNPFTISGILKPTGTPVDKTVHVSLQGIEAIHVNWKGVDVKQTEHVAANLVPKSVTAVMLGLKRKVDVFKIQREINTDRSYPLLAILPGVVLSELWQMMQAVEQILIIICGLVLLSSLLGMSTMLLSTMHSRQKELALMRAIGAHPFFIFMMIQIEAVALTLGGILVGMLGLTVTLLLGQSIISSHYGIFIELNFFNLDTFKFCGFILIASVLLTLFPSIHAYTYSLRGTLQSQ